MIEINNNFILFVNGLLICCAKYADPDQLIETSEDARLDKGDLIKQFIPMHERYYSADVNYRFKLGAQRMMVTSYTLLADFLLFK